MHAGTTTPERPPESPSQHLSHGGPSGVAHTPVAPRGVRLRRGTLADAAACGTICFEAFASIADRHRFPRDFPSPEVATELVDSLLARPDIYAVVAEVDGRVVGSNFLWEADAIAGVGPVTVDPAVQNGQVGRRLMGAVLERAREQQRAGVRLVQAAYHCRSLSLYTKLGFDAREPLSVMQGLPLRVTLPDYTVRPASEDDHAACDALCHRLQGIDRSAELLGAIRRGSARVVLREDRLVGYTTGIRFFGHSVAEGNGAMEALIADAPSFDGPGFLLPTRNGPLFRWCLAHGLRVVFPATLMSAGPYQEPAGAFLPSILY